MHILNPIAENLWESSQPLRGPGLRMEHRMTVARLESGELWVHSPVAYDGSLAAELRAIGEPLHFVAPNTYHDLYWKEWFANFRDATFCCAAGIKQIPREFAFDRVLSQSVREPWESELPKLLVRGIPKINEFVFFHGASRTLIVTDLVFNFDVGQQHFFGKLFLKLNGVYDRVGCSRIFRHFIKDRAAFKESIEQLLALDFDRVVLAHGAMVETGGKHTLTRAFEWLLRNG